MRDNLVRNRLWLSSPEDFNDPFDTSIKVVVEGDPRELRTRFDTIFKARGMKWSERKRELDRIMSRPQDIPSKIQETFKTTIYDIGVCSFGGDPRSILMWSHYAANHEGFCLQFEIARDVENLICLKVNYSDEYPVLDYISGMDEIMSVLLTKFKGWSYEEERRLIVPEFTRQYIEFRPAALSGIIIGCRVREETLEALNSLLAERSACGHPMPRLYRVFLDEDNYQLIIKGTALR